MLVALYDELRAYPGGEPHTYASQPPELVTLLHIRGDRGRLSFFTTTTVFGTATDVTLAELAIESFFPADRATTEALRQALPL